MFWRVDLHLPELKLQKTTIPTQNFMVPGLSQACLVFTQIPISAAFFFNSNLVEFYNNSYQGFNCFLPQRYVKSFPSIKFIHILLCIFEKLYFWNDLYILPCSSSRECFVCNANENQPKHVKPWEKGRTYQLLFPEK